MCWHFSVTLIVIPKKNQKDFLSWAKLCWYGTKYWPVFNFFLNFGFNVTVITVKMPVNYNNKAISLIIKPRANWCENDINFIMANLDVPRKRWQICTLRSKILPTYFQIQFVSKKEYEFVPVFAYAELLVSREKSYSTYTKSWGYFQYTRSYDLFRFP